MFDIVWLIGGAVAIAFLWHLCRPIKRQTYRSHDEGDMR